ncbi:MAG: glutamate--tRNA ligase family protein [Pirellulales bacterium]
MPDRIVRWLDGFAGEQQCNPQQVLGDFVIARMNGAPAYQLAVVVDDHDMNVTEIVRGDDLIPSTYRQLAIYEALGWQHPFDGTRSLGRRSRWSAIGQAAR